MKYKLKQIGEVAKQIKREIESQKGAVIVAMTGELGAGKTALTKVLAKILEINEEVSSPTFVLNAQYTIPNSQRKLEHIDLWRMEEFGELEQIGLKKMIEEKSIIIIEWADKFRDEVQRLPSSLKLRRASKAQVKLIWVKIEYGKKEDEREIMWEVL